MTDEKEVVKENAEADLQEFALVLVTNPAELVSCSKYANSCPSTLASEPAALAPKALQAFASESVLLLESRKETVNEVAMETANFDQTLRAFMRRAPFRPFTVALMNGDRVEVDHATALVMRDGVAVYLGPGGVPVIFDHEGVTQFSGDLSGSGADD
jgi:hypothetical protein